MKRAEQTKLSWYEIFLIWLDRVMIVVGSIALIVILFLVAAILSSFIM